MTGADIIQAAFKAWGGDYYRSVSLSEVARELGVSKAALYRHFCSKQALLEGMYEWFLDDYAAKVRDGFSQAAAAAAPEDALRIIIRVMMRYYAGNVNSFIFSLIYVYGERRLGNPREFLAKRGLDTGIFGGIRELAPPQAVPLILATLTYAMAYFHQLRPSERTAGNALRGEGNSAEQELERDISLTLYLIFKGAGCFGRGAPGGEGAGCGAVEHKPLDYGALEEKVSGIGRGIGESELLRSVAEAVAGAGPWAVSMEMVARMCGLSKSGLYAHFKNKGDMLTRLFITEFDRIIDFAEESMGFSEDPAERLYLAIFAICDYLRSRPDVLIALDWLRVRRVDFSEPEGKGIPSRLYRVFRDIQRAPELGRRFPGLESDWIPAWILFLIIASLMHGVRFDAKRLAEWFNMPKFNRRKLSREEFAKIPNETFRNLYRFIVQGINGPAPSPGS
jgi:AcrR family transcriptional regulator